MKPATKLNEPKVVLPNVARHTPFEHEITADPAEKPEFGATRLIPTRLWSVRAGRRSVTPSLPKWMVRERH